MNEGKRISSIDRLRKLEPVFSLADIQAGLGLDDRLARLYVSRWTKARLAQRFGGGVYFNLLKDEHGPRNRTAEAINKLVGVPVVVVGGAAITAGGWSTQVHRKIEVAVPVIRGSLTVPHTRGDIVLTPRYTNWFRILAGSADQSAQEGLAMAAPEYALADALLSGRRTISSGKPVIAPPPDEIDMGNFGGTELEKVRDAMRELGASEQEVGELTSPYEAAVEEPAETISF